MLVVVQASRCVESVEPCRPAQVEGDRWPACAGSAPVRACWSSVLARAIAAPPIARISAAAKATLMPGCGRACLRLRETRSDRRMVSQDTHSPAALLLRSLTLGRRGLVHGNPANRA